MRRTLRAVVFVGLLVGIASARQPNLYVSTTGNDQGGGNTCVNPLNPCRTITHTLT